MSAVVTKWLPTQAEVEAWLERYKRACAQIGDQATAFANREVDTGTAAKTRQWLADEEGWFDSWEKFQTIRRDVGAAMGAGYIAARDGWVAEDCPYPDRSDLAMAWHNSWWVGRRDYERRGGRY